MKGYFDGASRGNPGEAGAGACLIDEDDNVVWERSQYLGRKTNNEAEYMGLLLLLAEAKARGIPELEIYGDSKLVICQVRKEWKINLPHLKELAERVWKIMEGMTVRLAWVPRDHNKRADSLSNRGIDEVRRGRPASDGV